MGKVVTELFLLLHHAQKRPYNIVNTTLLKLVS